MKHKHIVISLGGSLIVPDTVDTIFLSDFKDMVLSFIQDGYTFTLFTGGGSVCRTYNTAADELAPGLTRDEKDWLGISITKVNAELLKIVFRGMVWDGIISDPNQVIDTDKPIIIGGGWKPGWSTDYDSVLYAERNEIKRVINVSNISHVYTADPKKDPTAQKIETISWAGYRELIPDTWEAGLHSPFDPVASKEAEKVGMEVLMLDGRNIPELKKAILGEDFVGTKIHP